MNDSELIGRAYALLAEGHVEAAEGYFERYMAARVRVLSAGQLREVWQKGVAGRRTQLAAREQAERERAERQGRGFGRLSRAAERPQEESGAPARAGRDTRRFWFAPRLAARALSTVPATIPPACPRALEKARRFLTPLLRPVADTRISAVP